MVHDLQHAVQQALKLKSPGAGQQVNMAGEPKEFAGHALRHRFETNSSLTSRRGRNPVYVHSWPKADLAAEPVASFDTAVSDP